VIRRVVGIAKAASGRRTPKPLRGILQNSAPHAGNQKLSGSSSRSVLKSDTISF